jgi:predicted acylesterase/phospholipase RssA
MTADKPFEIGLVLSGTVSAGAYTAGVMDFLIEALDAWYKNRSDNVKDTPTHDVLIRVLAGTSGGGLTTAVASAALYSKYMPRHDGERPDGKNNRLYTSCMHDINIEPLLETDDLANNQPLLSALNCKVINQISERIAYVIPDARRAYVAESLAFCMTWQRQSQKKTGWCF